MKPRWLARMHNWSNNMLKGGRVDGIKDGFRGIV